MAALDGRRDLKGRWERESLRASWKAEGQVPYDKVSRQETGALIRLTFRA